MTQEAKIKVRLDTSQAEAALRGVSASGEAAARRVSREVEDESGGAGLGGALLRGGALGLGALGVGAAARGSIGDVLAEGTSSIRASIDLGIGGPEARAAAAAREQTKQAFAASVGFTGDAESARGYFNQIRQLRERYEVGAAQIDRALGGDPVDLLQTVTDRITSAIRDGFSEIVSFGERHLRSGR